MLTYMIQILLIYIPTKHRDNQYIMMLKIILSSKIKTHKTYQEFDGQNFSRSSFVPERMEQKLRLSTKFGTPYSRLEQS